MLNLHIWRLINLLIRCSSHLFFFFFIWKSTIIISGKMFFEVKRIKSNVNKYKINKISTLSVPVEGYSGNVSCAVNLISTLLLIQIQNINLKLTMKSINNCKGKLQMQIKNERCKETTHFCRNMSL